MSNGYAAAYADVVSNYFVKKQAPIEYANFIANIKKSKLKFEVIAEALARDNMQYLDISLEKIRNINLAWINLKEMFNMITKLTLSIEYHNSNNNGDRYDDIDGAFFCVHGVYAFTQAGNKYRKSINRKFFVSYG